jgi:hypothetical protein
MMGVNLPADFKGALTLSSSDFEMWEYLTKRV